MRLYKIRDWLQNFENNRTREMKNMSWLPLPIKLSGNGYVYLMGIENGPAIFGCFIAILEASAQSKKRGELWRTAEIPHSPRTLAAVIRQPEELVNKTLDICSSNECDWFEVVEINTDKTNCGKTAVVVRGGCGAPADYLPSITDTHRRQIDNHEEKNIPEAGPIIPELEEMKTNLPWNGGK
jgi:hypothetical protein